MCIKPTALEINIIVFLNLSGLWRWQWFPCLFDLLHDPVFKMHFTVWLKLIWWKRYLCTMRDFQILSTTLILHTLFIIRVIYLLRSSFVAKLNTDENEKYEIWTCGLGSRIQDTEADLIYWWSFWTSMEALRGQIPYSDRALWHFNSMFGPSHSAKVNGRCMVCGL